VPAPDHVYAPAGFLLLVLVYLVPAHAHGLEQAVKSEVVVDGTKLDRFGTVDVQSKVPDVDPADLHTQLRALPGSVYSAEAIDKTVETMTIEISKRGHAFVQVRTRIDPDVAAHTVDVVFVVEEGPCRAHHHPRQQSNS
jgi:outer membrane protein assembly factor BamA